MNYKEIERIKLYLGKYQEEQKRFINILKIADIDIPLQHLCRDGEDAKEVRARVLRNTQEEVAEIDKLIAVLNEEQASKDKI